MVFTAPRAPCLISRPEEGLTVCVGRGSFFFLKREMLFLEARQQSATASRWPGRRALPSAGGSGSQAPFTPAYCPSAQIRVVLFRESGAGGRGQVVGEGCRRRMHGHPGDRSAARPGPPVWRGQGAPATSPRASRSLLSAPSFLFLHGVDLIITFASPGIRPAARLTFVHWLQFLQIQGNIRSTLISQAREFSATGQAMLTPARLHRGWARGPGPEP